MASAGAGGAGAGSAAGAGAESMAVVECTAAGSMDHFTVGTAPKPVVSAGKLLCKVHATGINPVDWKMGMFNFFVKSFPVVLGCDFCGEVVATGEGVTGFAVGDMVFGFPALGSGGTFSEYCLLDASWACKKPANISVEEAATTCCAFDTAGLVLFGPGGLELDGAPGAPIAGTASVLLWGGSTTVGMAAIQLASQAGYTVITTASAKNHHLLKTLGATHCIDYHDDDHMDRLRALATETNLRYAADFAGAPSAAAAASVLKATAEEHGRLATIAGMPKDPIDNVDAKSVLLGTAYGNEAQSAYVAKFHKEVLVAGFAAGTLAPLPVQTLNGMEGIVEALKLSQGHKVSAQKLAVRLLPSSADESGEEPKFREWISAGNHHGAGDDLEGGAALDFVPPPGKAPFFEPMSEWLFKRGHKWHTWHKRYGKLEGNTLTYFDGMHGGKAKGSLTLGPKSTVRMVDHLHRNRRCFLLTGEDGTELLAHGDTGRDTEKWIMFLKAHMDKAAWEAAHST